MLSKNISNFSQRGAIIIHKRHVPLEIKLIKVGSLGLDSFWGPVIPVRFCHSEHNVREKKKKEGQVDGAISGRVVGGVAEGHHCNSDGVPVEKRAAAPAPSKENLSRVRGEQVSQCRGAKPRVQILLRVASRAEAGDGVARILIYIDSSPPALQLSSPLSFPPTYITLLTPAASLRSIARHACVYGVQRARRVSSFPIFLIREGG